MPGFQLGELVLSSKPYAYVLGDKFRGQICDFCFKKKDNLKRCSQCSFLYFCDKNCQAGGWKQHKVECKFIKRAGTMKPTQSLRLISLIIFKIKKYGQEEPYEEVNGRRVSFSTLMSHVDEVKGDLKRCQVMTALLITLKEYIGVDNIPPSDEFAEIFGKMTVNSFCICDGEMKTIGSGLYLGASVFDHACSPDALVIFDGKDLNVRMMRSLTHRDINKVYISYIGTLQLKEEKQKKLHEQYYFSCKCTYCEESDNDEKMTKLLNNSKETKEQAKKCDQELQRIKQMLKDNKDPAAINEDCVKLAEIQIQILADTHLSRIKALAITFNLSIKLKNWTDSLIIGACLDEPYRLYYGNHHPQLGIHLFKIGKILHYQGLSRVAVPKLIEAESIFKITHGEQHPLTKELTELLQEAKLAATSIVS